MRVRVVGGVPYFEDGSRVCSKCLRRPARVDRSGQQRYCRVCATEDMRLRRQGKVSMLLAPEERELIRELRQVQPAGRHHAGLSR